MPSFAKNWCFTLQVKRREAARIMSEPQKKPLTFKKSAKVAYYIYSLEVASTGQHHLQGTICFATRKRIKAVKEAIGGKPHCEVCKDLQASIDYCRKPETHIEGPWTEGEEPKGQGARTDIAVLYRFIKEGRSLKRIVDENPAYARMEKHAKFMKSLVGEDVSQARERKKFKVIILYGSTETGKTFAAHHTIPEGRDVYSVEIAENPAYRTWFDNYDGQQVIIIDEVEPGQMHAKWFKRVCQSYKLQVQVKGSTVWAQWDTVIITSNYSPKEWFAFPQTPGGDALREAIKRRITEIWHFTGPRRYQKVDWDETPLEAVEHTIPYQAEYDPSHRHQDPNADLLADMPDDFLLAVPTPSPIPVIADTPVIADAPVIADTPPLAGYIPDSDPIPDQPYVNDSEEEFLTK